MARGGGLTVMNGENKKVQQNSQIRKLTPIECARLQTFPDNYLYDKDKKYHVSESQLYKMLGNSWTVDVIVHIFKHLPKEFFL